MAPGSVRAFPHGTDWCRSWPWHRCCLREAVGHGLSSHRRPRRAIHHGIRTHRPIEWAAHHVRWWTLVVAHDVHRMRSLQVHVVVHHRHTSVRVHCLHLGSLRRRCRWWNVREETTQGYACQNLMQGASLDMADLNEGWLESEHVWMVKSE